MGLTKIEWTATVLPTGEKLPGYTFNPWWGCTKVSQGCKHCYADAQDHRLGGSHWGPGNPRRMLSEAHWRKPLRWNADAQAAGLRRKVFCASMADVFEQLAFDHPSYDAMSRARCDLWALIKNTPWLDWLLLTKRPENCFNLTPATWEGGWPANVWIGTSVETQAAADTRIPHLLRVPAGVRFLSCEPLLGPVDLRRFLCCPYCAKEEPLVNDDGVTYHHFGGITNIPCPLNGRGSAVHNIDWVICGGESGPQARPMHPDWARGLREQCQAAGVPFFFKQWGMWKPLASEAEAIDNNAARLWEWNDGGLRHYSINVGKHAAGRLLDGETWSEFPASPAGGAFSLSGGDPVAALPESDPVAALCPCSLDDPRPALPGYKLCEDCLEVATASGLGEEAFRA